MHCNFLRREDISNLEGSKILEICQLIEVKKARMGEAGFNKLEKSGDIFYESYSNAKSFLRHFDNKKNHEITRQNAKRKKNQKLFQPIVIIFMGLEHHQLMISSLSCWLMMHAVAIYAKFLQCVKSKKYLISKLKVS